MSNKEFYKKFEQILNEVFGDRPKSMTPLESFFDKIKLKTNNLIWITIFIKNLRKF